MAPSPKGTWLLGEGPPLITSIYLTPRSTAGTYLSALLATSQGQALYMTQGCVLAEAAAQPPKGWGLKQETPIYYSCYHVFSKMATHLGTGAWNVLMLTRKQDASQIQRNILLTTMISPAYLHQGPTKLGEAAQGTASNSNSQNCQTFNLNRKERWERERTQSTYPETEASSQLQHCRRVKISTYCSPSISRLQAAKRPAPPQPLLSRHTSMEMLKRGLVPSGGCYHISNTVCCRRVQKGLFLHLGRVRLARTAWSWKNFKQFGLKEC